MAGLASSELQAGAAAASLKQQGISISSSTTTPRYTYTRTFTLWRAGRHHCNHPAAHAPLCIPTQPGVFPLIALWSRSHVQSNPLEYARRPATSLTLELYPPRRPFPRAKPPQLPGLAISFFPSATIAREPIHTLLSRSPLSLPRRGARDLPLLSPPTR